MTFGFCLLSLHAYFFYSILVTMMLNQAAVAFNRFITVCHQQNPPFQVSDENAIAYIVRSSTKWQSLVGSMYPTNKGSEKSRYCEI